MLQISPLEIDQPQATVQLVASDAVWRELITLATPKKRKFCPPRLRDASCADIFYVQDIKQSMSANIVQLERRIGLNKQNPKRSNHHLHKLFILYCLYTVR